MTGRCEECRWWERCIAKDLFLDAPDPLHVGDCSCAKFVYIGDTSSKEWTETPIDGMAYCDYELYQASFKTGAQYGCVHFEKKEGK